MESDATRLIEAARLGNRTAAVSLIELFYTSIYAFLRRLTAHDAEAADLTQRTFVRVWQALPTFAGRSSVSSWIHSIAYHAYVDWRRSDRRAVSCSDEWWAACAATDPAPDMIVARVDMAATLYRFVDALEPDLRDSVQLHYYQDMTLQQTADAMNVATSTVKYRLRQAVGELQKKLASEGPSQNPQTVLRAI